jgi:hypothetical protein
LLVLDGPTLTQLECILASPPIGAYEPRALNALFAEVAPRYGLRSLIHHEQGAVFEAPGVLEVRFEVGKMTFRQSLMATPLSVSKDNLVDIAAQARSRLPIPVFIGPQIQISALWSLDDGDAAGWLARRTGLLDRFEDGLLGEGTAPGVRLIRHVPAGDIEDVRLEPFFQDPAHLYLSVECTYPTTMIQEDLDALAEVCDRAAAVFHRVVQRLAAAA